MSNNPMPGGRSFAYVDKNNVVPEGRNLSLKGGTIRFFKVEGYHLSADEVRGDKTWAITAKGLTFRTAPDDMMPTINCSLNRHFGRGNVGMIIVNPLQAVTLFLQGLITAENLAFAKESPASIEAFVDIPGVLINHRRVIISVRERTAGIAIADVYGNIL